jgi:hypothetical protein
VAFLRVGVPPREREACRVGVVEGGRVRPVFGGACSARPTATGRCLGVKVGHLSDPS